MECGKAASGVRKVKKKQVKDDLDRIKQAEKKKRRLEKALAASAAIISELEKKNQKKKEEQQRLDDECAAIAEAVALQVLIGEESENSCVRAIMQKDDEWYPWGCCARATNVDVFVGDSRARTTAVGSPNENAGWVSDGYGGSRSQWSGYGYGYGYGYGSSEGGYYLNDVHGAPYAVEREWESGEVSEAALIAAQAISSLQIADDGVNAFVFNRMLRG